MIRRHSFKGSCARSVTDRAVVVALRRVRETQQRNHVLMPVMRKLDRELQLRRGIAERVPHVIAWRSLRVTHGTDRRSCAAEELWAMTAHTRVVTRIIIDIRERYLVTRVAGRFVFLCGVRKF